MRLLLLLSLLVQISQTADCSWNTCNKWSSDSKTLNVHLVPHTHDDLGWIKTADQYYWGAKPELVPVGVQYIYNTVIDELQKSPERKFSFAETGFLWRWYSSQGDAEKHKLQKLVKSGQIELIGGGWSQNDEAASHYVDIIDQMTFGLRKLTQLFGECGKAQVAWQIDPFGHSREQANLFAMMGYSSLFFARIHYLEKQARLENKTLEFVWNASDDLKTQILTGAFYQDNYGPPPGFCWDALCGDDPIMDNPELEEYNVDEKVAGFVDHVKKQASFQRSNHVMLLMGSDFQYTNANSWYTNLDKLIRYVREKNNTGINVFYSTPSCYVKGLLEAQPRLTSKNDDFFPYASSEHSFWTGYFTSRPTFKQMIRDASALLQLAKRLDVLADLGPSDDSDVEIMSKASGLVQHHDAVTGTAKQNVTKDYYKQLGRALVEGELVVNDFLKVIMPKKTGGAVTQHYICHLYNETICEPIIDVSTFAVTVFNPLAKEISKIITIPYYSKQAIVQNDEGKKTESQIFKTFQTVLSHPNRAPYELSFEVILPALGYKTYIVDNSTSIKSTSVQHPARNVPVVKETVTISNEFISLDFDPNGLLTSYTDLTTKTVHPFKQQFFYYRGEDNVTDQTSGAYVFRPKSQEPVDFNSTIKIEISKGNLSQEVRQTIAPWISQIIRLKKGSPEVVFDWTVGPIPKDNGKESIEVVTRYMTDIKSASVFWTDANGRQMMRRKVGESTSFTYQDTEPVAGNYYPVTNRVYIKDENLQLTVLTDRSQGATSRDGMIELMLHRRCFVDDHWGVEEALDERGADGKGLIARGKHHLLLSPSADAASVHRPRALEIFNKPVITFAPLKSPTDFISNNNLKFAGMSRALPSFVNLLSMEKWHKASVLLRFEHIFQSDEDKINSRPMTVDIKDLFTRFDIVSMNELLLAGNRNATTLWKNRPARLRDTQFQIKPQEIKTFEVEVKWK